MSFVISIGLLAVGLAIRGGKQYELFAFVHRVDEITDNKEGFDKLGFVCCFNNGFLLCDGNWAFTN